MTNKKVMSVFTIFAVAVMMGAASIAPAYAATKLTEIDLDEEIEVTGIGAIFCDDDDGFKGFIKGSVVEWDNGHTRVNVVSHFLLTTASGEPSGVFHGTEHTVVSTFDGDNVFPVVVQANVKVTCNGEGQVFNDHFGFTIHEDGTITLHINP